MYLLPKEPYLLPKEPYLLPKEPICYQKSHFLIDDSALVIDVCMYGCVHCMRIVCKFVCLFLCMNVYIYTSINRNKLATIFGWVGFLVIKKAVFSTKRAVSSIKRALFSAKRAIFIKNTFLATVSDRAGSLTIVKSDCASEYHTQ